MANRNEFQQRAQVIEDLIRKLEQSADVELRAAAKRLVQALMEMHGEGLERALEIVYNTGAAGEEIMARLQRDDVVKGLLLLHGLHPDDLETRVREALEKTRPYLQSHGGNVELLHVDDAGVVKLRLDGSCHGCPSSAVTLKLAIEDAIFEAAPDVTRLIVDGVTQAPAPIPGYVPIEQLQNNGHALDPARDGTEWEEVDGIHSLLPGAASVLDVSGVKFLFCRLDGNYYAYENRCPGCGHALDGALLEAAVLACPSCKLRYDVVRAGRGVDQTALHLAPLPLLVEQNHAKIAMPLSKAQRGGAIL
jgi:Fe-S cluster biogenesis protein NfuA/nitrite reductase/ring-hydroxylating ferredoxin subunit